MFEYKKEKNIMGWYGNPTTCPNCGCEDEKMWSSIQK
jgi:hypothetical protein